MDLQYALDHGLYSEWISECTITYNEIFSGIASELELLKTWPSDKKRLDAFYNLIRYYSQANKSYQETSLRMHSAIEVSERRLRKGEYDSGELAARFLANVERYDREVTVPLCEQIGQELRREFPNSHVLFLGRDFTPVYLFLTKKYGKSPLYHMANVSRGVRDKAMDNGQMYDLKRFLEQLGLEKDSLINRGIVITDAGKRGRIPAAILRALTLDMSETEIYSFLRQAHIRYMKSTKLDRGDEVHRQVKELAKHNSVSQKNLEKLLPPDGVRNIKEFQLDYPRQTKKFVGQRNKILEWRSKPIEVAIDIRPDGLITKPPETPADRISLLLGLYADLSLANMAEGKASGAESAPQPVAEHASRHESRHGRKRESHLSLVQPIKEESAVDFRKELDRISRHSRLESLRRWREKPERETEKVYKNFQNPHSIILGEGTNNIVYQSDDGTAFKLIKSWKDARKNLLLVWAESIVNRYGIHTAQVISYDPYGIWIKQEYVPGSSLESRYGSSVPEHIKDQVLEEWKSAKKLAKEENIWLDIKAANYHERENGQIVNVDFAPRLNSTYYRFFKSSHGRSLKDKEFLELFFKYDSSRKHKASGIS